MDGRQTSPKRHIEGWTLICGLYKPLLGGAAHAMVFTILFLFSSEWKTKKKSSIREFKFLFRGLFCVAVWSLFWLCLIFGLVVFGYFSLLFVSLCFFCCRLSSSIQKKKILSQGPFSLTRRKRSQPCGEAHKRTKGIQKQNIRKDLSHWCWLVINDHHGAVTNKTYCYCKEKK